VSLDERELALPKLYGAPAYARPPTAAAVVERPFDPDELPIEAYQSDEDREFVSTLPTRASATSGTETGRHSSSGSARRRGLRPRPFSLRAIAGHLRGNR